MPVDMCAAKKRRQQERHGADKFEACYMGRWRSPVHGTAHQKPERNRMVEEVPPHHTISRLSLFSAGFCLIKRQRPPSPQTHTGLPYRTPRQNSGGNYVQVLDVLAACSRDAMSARREHVALVAKQKVAGGKAGPGGKAKPGGKAGPGAKACPAKPDEVIDTDKAEAHPHPEDEDSLRRWEELLRSVDVNGGRWRSDVVDGGSFGG